MQPANGEKEKRKPKNRKKARKQSKEKKGERKVREKGKGSVINRTCQLTLQFWEVYDCLKATAFSLPPFLPPYLT